MAGPWEKFQSTSSNQSSEGPWSKFQQPTESNQKQESSWKDIKLPFGTTAGGLVQGGLNALPSAGAAAGGVAGGAFGAGAGGIGAIPGGLAGAGLGGAAGESLKNLGEKYLMGQDKDREDVYEKPVKGLMEGVTQEMGGQILNKAVDSILGDTLSRSRGKIEAPTSKEVEDAASRLGVEPTQGMKSENYVVKNLENSVSQDPTFAGAYVRSKQRPVQEAIGSKVNSMLDDAGSLSPYESGGKMKEDLISKIAEKHDPIKALYDQIGESTPHIDLSEKSRGVVANNLRRSASDMFAPGSDGAKTAEQFAQQLEQLKNVDQIAQARSSAGGILRDQNASYGEKQAASMMIDKLDRLNQSSILRSAVASRGHKIAGENVAQDLIQDIKDARTQYKGLKTNLNTLGEGSGLLSGKGGVSQAVNEIESVPNEKLGQALFKTGDNDFLNFLKEEYPEAYHGAKTQYLSDIAKKSQDVTGEVSPKKFLQSIKSLGPEAREHLFGDGSNQKIEDMVTLLQSTPTKIGASDTPRGLMFQQMLNPLTQVSSAGRLGLLKAYPALENNPEAVKLINSYIGRGVGKTTGAATGLLLPQDRTR